MKISSPMAMGNGAIIVHQTLEKHLRNYEVNSYPLLIVTLQTFVQTLAECGRGKLSKNYWVYRRQK